MRRLPASVFQNEPIDSPAGQSVAPENKDKRMPCILEELSSAVLFEPLEPRLLLSASVQEIEVNPVTHTGLFAEVTTQESGAAEPEAFALLAAPPSFDLRTGGHVTSVKNQGGCGSCWTFATYGSLESSILVEGGPTRDLS